MKNKTIYILLGVSIIIWAVGFALYFYNLSLRLDPTWTPPAPTNTNCTMVELCPDGKTVKVSVCDDNHVNYFKCPEKSIKIWECPGNGCPS